ncbi:S41 family peptidase [Streptomyces cinnamoneus]|uniref:Peptidase n=1 Tax=Streptomyces cinnamoneus TaxID=53446 RepID=A0A918WRP7_STRCJ|nr:S41 family peptidase [Streptomyces cinnamoneus]GHC74710.1 peptidase [Streptomyces cinnamoneus]
MINRPRRRRAAALLLATATALTTAVTVRSAAAAPRPGSLDGVWRMDGYGTVVTIEEGGRRLRSYETTAVSCLPGAADATRSAAKGPFRQEGGSTVSVTPDGPRRAQLRYAESVGHRELRRVDALPAACREKEPPKDNLAVFDVFWQTFAENYPFFAAKGVDWQAVRDRYRPRVTDGTTPDELYGILAEMIEPLHDGHTFVKGGVGDDYGRYFAGHREDTTIPDGTLMKRIDEAIAGNLDGAVPHRWGKGRIAYADLPDGTGYLRVTGFVNYTDEKTYEADSAELDRALDEVFTKARTAGPKALRGLVLDLRFNGGGSDRLGLRIAERLTSRPYTAYLKHARNDPKDPAAFTRPEPVRVEPHRGPVHTGPVAVLTGRLTISAGETTTQALMGRTPRTVRIGENTQGSFSDRLDRALPNGWSFGLPNEEFLSAADGRTTYDGAGIAPDVRTPVFTEENLAKGDDPALREARRRLTAGR